MTIGPAIRAGVHKEDYGTGLHRPEYYWQVGSSLLPSLTASLAIANYVVDGFLMQR